jgi:chaperonin GroES
MKIRPLGDRLVVKRVEEQTKTSGGILIPDNAKEKPLEGSVVAVGPGRVLANGRLRELELKSGDVVLFGKYNGTEVKIDGVDYVILREDDVLGVVKG